MYQTIRLKLYPEDYPFAGTKEEKKESWKKFKNLIRDLSYHCSKIKNISSSCYGMHVVRTKSGKKDYEKPKENELRKQIMLECKEKQFSINLCSCIVGNCINEVKKAYSGNAVNKEIWNGTRVVSYYKNDTTIPCSHKYLKPNGIENGGNFKIIKDENGRWCVNVGFLAVGSGNNDRRNYVIHNLDNGQKEIFERMISGEYKFDSADLFIKKGNVYFNIAYQIKEKKKIVIPGRVLGVDLGIRTAAAVALNDNDMCKALIHDQVCVPINKMRQRILREKKKIGRSLRSAGGKRSGHGRHNKLRTFDILSGWQRNFIKTLNHQISAIIIDYAKKWNVEGISIENLTGIVGRVDDVKKAGRWLRNWAYFELQQFITYKAQKEGIKVFRVNPAYTSQTCPVCNHCEKGNRNKSKFKCIKCGHEQHADIVGARNISYLGYQSLLKNSQGNIAL